MYRRRVSLSSFFFSLSAFCLPASPSCEGGRLKDAETSGGEENLLALLSDQLHLLGRRDPSERGEPPRLSSKSLQVLHLLFLFFLSVVSRSRILGSSAVGASPHSFFMN